jgi:hypothetical protein
MATVWSDDTATELLPPTPNATVCLQSAYYRTGFSVATEWIIRTTNRNTRANETIGKRLAVNEICGNTEFTGMCITRNTLKRR